MSWWICNSTFDTKQLKRWRIYAKGWPLLHTDSTLSLSIVKPVFILFENWWIRFMLFMVLKLLKDCCEILTKFWRWFWKRLPFENSIVLLVKKKKNARYFIVQKCMCNIMFHCKFCMPITLAFKLSQKWGLMIRFFADSYVVKSYFFFKTGECGCYDIVWLLLNSSF